MNLLPAFCIQRPAFTIVISLVMTIVGIIGFSNLPVRWIPNVTPPQVSIETKYPGANAKLVEHDVTKVIEDSLSGVAGMESITSVTRQGQSVVSITFKLGRNMDAAVEDVRSSVERVRGNLPKDIQNLTVSKADPNSDAMMYISFYDPHMNARELSDYLDKFVVPTFETANGVGSVAVYGKRITAMQIKLDPSKLAGANITVDEVAQILHDHNTSIPSGQIRGRDRFYSVITDTTLKTEQQFNDLIMRANQNQVIRLKDIGVAKYDAEDNDSSFRVNGRAGIALGIVPQSTANPMDVEASVKKVFTEIKPTLPANMEMKIIYNQADYIHSSIHSVYESFIEAIIFVWIVIFIFLCSFRATLVPIITIPVCLIATFAILYCFGFSVNTITLMAFVLAIGLVVDDAIVMLENISRHIEEGMAPVAAAIKGSREMIFPIIAMTITLAAVYAPIAFTGGLLGVLFKEFTYTLAGAVLISGVVALTLSPMMCARILKASTQQTKFSDWVTERLSLLQHRYAILLQRVLQRKKQVLIGLIIVAVFGGVMSRFIASELAPAEDMNQIYVHVAAPRSASYQYTDTFVKQLEAIYQTIPDIDTYLTINHSAPHSFHVLILKPKNQRKLSTQAIIAALTAEASDISGVRTNIFAPPPPLSSFAGGDDGDNLGLVIMTSSDYRKLQQTSQRVMDAVKLIPGFTHVENGLKWDNEQFQINVDRDRAADLKIPITSITNTISSLIAGKNIGKTDDANIFIKLNDAALADPNIFHQLYVRNMDNNMLPLSSVLSVNVTTAPEVFRHTERMRADTIYLSLAQDQMKLATAISTLQKIAKENLSDDMKFSFAGEAKSFLDSSGKTVLTFLLALVFIYLVLVAQFESFIDPLIIMLTVPFAIIGALMTLKVFGGTLNIYSNIGLITLVGLIAKHGILITEFANRQRGLGKSINDAVVEAALLRLRPILMTTAAMVLGALPLAFAMGPGAESRQQIGLVVTGGMLFGTFFSLIIVPIAYTYLSPFRNTVLTTAQE